MCYSVCCDAKYMYLRSAVVPLLETTLNRGQLL